MSRSLRMATTAYSTRKNNIVTFKFCFIISSVSEIYLPKDLTVIHQRTRNFAELLNTHSHNARK